MVTTDHTLLWHFEHSTTCSAINAHSRTMPSNHRKRTQRAGFGPASQMKKTTPADKATTSSNKRRRFFFEYSRMVICGLTPKLSRLAGFSAKSA